MPEPERGIYACATCAQALYCTDDKQTTPLLDWAVFTKPVSSTAIVTRSDVSFGLRRTEIICSKCGTHVGHLFKDSGALERHNISPESITFVAAEAVHLRKRSGSLPTSTIFTAPPLAKPEYKLLTLSTIAIPFAAALIFSSSS